MLKLPFLSFNKSQNKFLTIDIGSDSVKCLAFYNDAGTAKIIGSGRQSLEPGQVRSGTIVDLEGVELAVKDSIFQATQDLEDQISDVVFGLSGNYSFSAVTTAKLIRPHPNQISVKELESICQKITDTAYTQTLNDIEQTLGPNNLEIESVTNTLVYTKVDDKLVKNPTEHSGSKIEAALFTAYTPKYHLKNLRKIAQHLGLKIVSISPELYALTNSLKLSKDAYLDCVIINVGGDTTEVGVIFGGGLVATKILPIGGSQFTYQISQRMGLSIKEAENLKKNYSYGKLTQNESLMIQDCLQEVLEIWISGLQLLFSEFTGVKTFAPKIYIAGGSINLPDTVDFLTKEPWARSIPFKSPPEFSKVTITDLPKVVDSTQKAAGVDWVMPAALATIYFEAKDIHHD